MAVDMFLKSEKLKGESMDKTYKDAIDVLAWSWGASNASSAHVGGGAGEGKVNVGDLSITKYVDKASAALWKMVCTGDHIDEMSLIVRKAGGNPLEYITMTFHEVYVTSVSTGGSGGESKLTENIVFSFAKFTFKYVEQDEKGTKGKDFPFGWDVKANDEYKK